MADQRSTTSRGLKAKLQILKSPVVWGVGLMLMIPLGFLVDDGGTPDRSIDNPDALPTTVSNSTGSQSGRDSVSDFSGPLEDPTLSKLGVDPADGALQADLPDNFLTTSLTSPTSKAASQGNPDFFSTVPSVHSEDGSTWTKSASLSRSSWFSDSPLNPSTIRSGKDNRRQTTASRLSSRQARLDRPAGLQTGNQQNPWQPNASANLPTTSGNSSLINSYGQPTNSSLPATPATAGQVSRLMSYPVNLSQPSPSPATTGYTTSPAFRTPVNSPGSFSGSSTFTTPNSSQIIQTFQPSPVNNTPSSYPAPTNSTAQPQITQLQGQSFPLSLPPSTPD